MGVRDFLKDFAKDIKAGYEVGEKATYDAKKRRGSYRHSVFDPRFAKDMFEGTEGYTTAAGTKIPATRKLNNPAEFLGAYGARLATDLGQDSSRQFLGVITIQWL